MFKTFLCLIEECLKAYQIKTWVKYSKLPPNTDNLCQTFRMLNTSQNLWIKVQYANICLVGKSKNAGKCDLKTFECSRNSEQIPVFGNMSSNITVQREGTAFLHCPVKNPGDRPVSYPLVSKYKQEYKLYL